MKQLNRASCVFFLYKCLFLCAGQERVFFLAAKNLYNPNLLPGIYDSTIFQKKNNRVSGSNLLIVLILSEFEYFSEEMGKNLGQKSRIS